MSDRPILYTSPSSRGLRASWAAAELGIELEYRIVPFPPRARAKWYFDVNPLATVPALEHEGYVMTESSAIAHYLATRWGPSSLAVAPDEEDYAAYLDFLHHADATITFPQTVYLRFVMMEPETPMPSGTASAWSRRNGGWKGASSYARGDLPPPTSR